MKRIYKIKKGFTAIELLLALALGAIFTAIAFSFFMPQQQALNNVEKKSQLQMDMQQIMESFSQSAMEASGISEICVVPIIGLEAQKVDLSSSGITGNISNIIFTVNDTDIYNNYSIDNIRKISVNNKIKSMTDGKLLSSNLESLKLTPLGGTNFLNCYGITVDVMLSSSDGKITYSASNSIYFRNKSN